MTWEAYVSSPVIRTLCFRELGNDHPVPTSAFNPVWEDNKKGVSYYSLFNIWASSIMSQSVLTPNRGNFPLKPMQLESSGSFSQIPSDPSDGAEESEWACGHELKTGEVLSTTGVGPCLFPGKPFSSQSWIDCSWGSWMQMHQHGVWRVSLCIYVTSVDGCGFTSLLASWDDLRHATSVPYCILTQICNRYRNLHRIRISDEIQTCPAALPQNCGGLKRFTAYQAQC